MHIKALELTRLTARRSAWFVGALRCWKANFLMCLARGTIMFSVL